MEIQRHRTLTSPRLRVSVHHGPSRTRQSALKETDVNVIMSRYLKTGMVPAGARKGVYADVSSIGSYQEAISLVRDADERFSALPAAVRKEFGNDPGSFLEAFESPEGLELLEELGVVERGTSESLDVTGPTDTNKEVADGEKAKDEPQK